KAPHCSGRARRLGARAHSLGIARGNIDGGKEILLLAARVDKPHAAVIERDGAPIVMPGEGAVADMRPQRRALARGWPCDLNPDDLARDVRFDMPLPVIARPVVGAHQIVAAMMVVKL